MLDQNLTFTATVTSQAKGTPTGTVSFFDGVAKLGDSNLNSSAVAAFTLSTLSLGTHSITATYHGDANFAPSTSTVLYEIVQGAIVALFPTSLNFGNYTVGITSSQKGVTLENTGNIGLAIKLIGITGTNSGDFAQTNNCSSPIAPNGSCTINVIFKPTGTGTRNANLSITDNAPDSSQTVTLSGAGIAPIVTPRPKSLSFGPQLLGTTSQPLPVVLSTNGTLNISSITATAQFAQTNNCGTGLSAGGSCTINVTFRPTANGPQSGTLTISDNGQASPQTVPLSGTGIAPSVSLSVSSLALGQQLIRTTSASKSVTLSNTGKGPLNITSIKATGDFGQSNNCGTSVAAGAKCTINVTFKPTGTGARSGTLSITDNASGSPQKVTLTGTGIAVTISTTALSFGNQLVGTSSAVKLVTLTNHGTAALTISAITISGDYLKSTPPAGCWDQNP